MSDPAAIAIDFDLFCLTCGYNLRGLIGDPVRCPECGAMNGVAEPIVPDAMVEVEATKMARLPHYAFYLMFVTFLLIAILFLAWELAPCVAYPAILLGGLAFTVVLISQDACVGQPGWLRCVMRYWICALIEVGILVAGAVVAIMQRATNPGGQYAGYVFLASMAMAWLVDRVLLSRADRNMRQFFRKPAFFVVKRKLHERSRASGSASVWNFESQSDSTSATGSDS